MFFSTVVCVCVCVFSHSDMSDSFQPHGLQPTRLLCPWDSPGKNIGVGCHSLLQGLFLTQGSNPHLLHGQAGFFTTSATWKALQAVRGKSKILSESLGPLFSTQNNLHAREIVIHLALANFAPLQRIQDQYTKPEFTYTSNKKKIYKRTLFVIP